MPSTYALCLIILIPTRSCISSISIRGLSEDNNLTTLLSLLLFPVSPLLPLLLTVVPVSVLLLSPERGFLSITNQAQ